MLPMNIVRDLSRTFFWHELYTNSRADYRVGENIVRSASWRRELLFYNFPACWQAGRCTQRVLQSAKLME